MHERTGAPAQGVGLRPELRKRDGFPDRAASGKAFLTALDCPSEVLGTLSGIVHGIERLPHIAC